MQMHYSCRNALALHLMSMVTDGIVHAQQKNYDGSGGRFRTCFSRTKQMVETDRKRMSLVVRTKARVVP